jgi:hypothetical protein
VKIQGVPYVPRYSSDEIALGVVIAVVLHVLSIGPFVANAILPKTASEEEEPRVARPVVQATLLKLGKPLDPKRLPDRLVPQARTAPKREAVASREDPGKTPDAGPPPPPNTEESDIANLIAQSDPFAEDPSKARPEEGHELGVDGGTETDPSKVRAGDMYAAQLGAFFGERLTIPSVISVGEARRLCATFQINTGRNMTVWHVRQSPVKSSGNELFDDAARNMLLKLLEDKTALPQPPKEVDELYRARTLQLVVPGDPHGDASRCK